jgi:hypothetical protein
MAKRSSKLRNVAMIACLAGILVSGNVMAQNDSVPADGKKKGGGFLKAVESNTGLKVSKETLFVYPVIGEWKMEVVSCIGDKATGEVIFKIKVIRLFGEYSLTSERCLMSEVAATGGKESFKLIDFNADPLYDFEINKTVEVTFQPIVGVPASVKSIDVKFYIRRKTAEGLSFEARRVPIEWK